MFCCGKVRCKMGNYVKPGTTFVRNVDKRSFHINHFFDCDSSGIIYLITCRKCNKQYVVSTTTSFRIRFNNHKSSCNRLGECRVVFLVSICMLIFGRITAIKGWMMYVCRLLTSLTLGTRLVGRLFRSIN